MSKMSIFFFSLLFLSLFSFIAGFNTEGLGCKITQYDLYFQGWISLANLIFCLSLAIATYRIYKYHRLNPLKFVPLSLFFFGIGILIIGFHVGYCKVCGDIGFCGTAHDYPNAISILGICISLVLYLVSISDTDDFSHALSILYHSLLIGFTAIIIVLFVSIFYMKLPEPSPYEILKHPNIQGLVFLFISIFSFVAFLDFFLTFRATGRKVFMHVGIQFLITALVQLVAFYHLLTCYWCDVGKCSEYFGMAGIFILIAMYTLWYSYSQLKKDHVVN